jgi:hypothetical protein
MTFRVALSVSKIFIRAATSHIGMSLDIHIQTVDIFPDTSAKSDNMEVSRNGGLKGASSFRVSYIILVALVSENPNVIKIPATVSAEGYNSLVIIKSNKLGGSMSGRVAPVGIFILVSQSDVLSPDSGDKLSDFELDRLDPYFAAGLDLPEIVEDLGVRPELRASVESYELAGVAFERETAVSFFPSAGSGVAFFVTVSIL